ncbi:MAG: tRNA (N6-isopentenyl adenosine(37)-C2)-methylthiotransferase MiaB [Candidatus Omnitrophica bacterium]|nr:tRNA (N6-isopentenyl adenosine(37)-C2)-methylthiotransferase MiaB [Candidatus Omnitrophota bacterium]
MPDKKDKTKNETKGLRLYIRTFGCQMNIRDSELVCGLLGNAGYKMVEEPQDAGVIIINTCSVRQHAEDRVWSVIGAYKKEQLKRKGKLGEISIIGLIGCMAQNYKEQVFEKSPDVDFVVGPADIHKIPDIIDTLIKNKGLFEKKIWETDGLKRPEHIYHDIGYDSKKHTYVVISEGCSNFCSYCVVPFVRGALRHRSHKNIIKEINEALDKGVTSVTLLGQNVNSYQDGAVDFVKLLELVNSLKGLKEFNFLTSHPKDTTTDLFKAIASLGKLKKELHLPLQSGSDRILKLMNRGYTSKYYLNLTQNYRKIVKNGLLSSDVILGFPSESEADFKDTLNLLKQIKFNAAYIFKYSPRPQTKAMALPDDVSKAEKEGRHKTILDLQRAISKSKVIPQKSPLNAK